MCSVHVIVKKHKIMSKYGNHTNKILVDSMTKLPAKLIFTVGPLYSGSSVMESVKTYGR